MSIKKFHTIISGIDSLSAINYKRLSKVSSVSYLKINSEIELKKALNNCDVFWFRLNHTLTNEIVKNVKCKYILCAATGLDHINLEACKTNNIKVISLFGEKDFLKEIKATAEHTLCLLLSLVRKTKLAFKHVEEGNWNRKLFKGTELYKKKIGVLGLGRLGKIVAEYYYALGMDVFFYDILPQEKIFKKKYTSTNSLESLIQQVDILSIHLPYNSKTHFLLNKKNLSLFKNKGIIVNTSRGGVINEEHLIHLIKKNKIAGYAADVLLDETIIENNKIVQLAKDFENVLITPHIAGNTYESIEKTETFVLTKLIDNLSLIK